MENDDRNLDRLLLVLREIELNKLADELYRASMSPPSVHLPTEQAMEHDGAHVNGGPSTGGQTTDASPNKVGEEMSFYDSGIITPESFTLPDSNSASSSDESPMFIHHDQPELVANQPRLATQINTTSHLCRRAILILRRKAKYQLR